MSPSDPELSRAPVPTGVSARYPRHALAAFLFTVVVGPLLGCLPLALGLGVAFVRNKERLQGLPDPDTYASFGLSMLTGAYRAGGVPALIVGVLVARVVWRHGNVGYLQVTLFVALACLGAVALAILTSILQPTAALGAGAIMLGPAILAGLLGRWLAACIIRALKRP